ncbi:MAG: lytic murein transglycosylase B [Gallionella sp.]
MKNILLCILSFVAVLLMTPVFAVSLPNVTDFIDKMVVKHHFKRDELIRLFDQAKHQANIIDAITRPATTKPWLDYRAVFVNAKRVKHGLLFWKRHRHDLIRAEKKYGVPQEIIVALIGVETFYGQHAGRYRTLDALTTLAFDYPRRAAFFQNELENYLLLTREQQLDPLLLKSSYAGAMGIPQFMPSSYRKYAVDFNGNHKADLLNESSDAIGSIGNYMQSYGWIKGGRIAVRVRVKNKTKSDRSQHSLRKWAEMGVQPRAKISGSESARLLDFTVKNGKQFWLGFNNFDVITRYNNSDYYAMSVFQLAQALKAAKQGKH